jgi:hypothetical protein
LLLLLYIYIYVEIDGLALGICFFFFSSLSRSSLKIFVLELHNIAVPSLCFDLFTLVLYSIRPSAR